MKIIIWTQAKRLFYLFSEALKKLLDINFNVIIIYKSVNLKKFKLKLHQIDKIISLMVENTITDDENIIINQLSVLKAKDPNLNIGGIDIAKTLIEQLKFGSNSAGGSILNNKSLKRKKILQKYRSLKNKKILTKK